MKKFFDKIRTVISTIIMSIALVFGFICFVPFALMCIIAACISPPGSKESSDKLKEFTDKLKKATAEFDKTGKFEFEAKL